jgi:hypothetical protein
MRTIPVPDWVKEAVDIWTWGAGINAGPLLRSINIKEAESGDTAFTPGVIWVEGSKKWRCESNHPTAFNSQPKKKSLDS